MLANNEQEKGEGAHPLRFSATASSNLIGQQSYCSSESACLRLSRSFVLFALFTLLGYLLSTLFIGVKYISASFAVCSPARENIYIVDISNLQVQCIVIHRAHIHDIGSLGDIKKRWRKESTIAKIFHGTRWGGLQIRYVDEHSIVIPGISDSHAHILEYGATQQLPLEGTKTIQGHLFQPFFTLILTDDEETVQRVKHFILSNPDILQDKTKLITGGGWDHTIWPAAEWPSSADLDIDPVIDGRPVILQSKDCHALWVSSKAMEASLPFPNEVEGGVIVRDKDGRPTGLLLDNAQDLLKQPELTEADLIRRFQVTVRNAHSMGLTSIHDAGLDPISLKFFRSQAEKGALPIRIYGMTYFNEDEEYWGNKTQPLISLGNGRLTARSVKIFADGALRTGGAALYENYADNPSTNGLMRIDPAILFDVIPKFLRDGWQVNVHAIGDRANGIILDVFESSLKGINVTALRPRLEHAQMMTKRDMVRLGKLGVIASVQPAHATSDMWYAQDRLGPERVKRLYAFRSIIDSGARIALGSDFPVESINPLSGFYAAVSRLSPTGQSPHGPGGWFPEQCLTRQEALRGMTIDPAYASFTEPSLGSLEIGKRADFTILSQDIMTIPASEILSTKVLATVIDGELVYGNI